LSQSVLVAVVSSVVAEGIVACVRAVSRVYIVAFVIPVVAVVKSIIPTSVAVERVVFVAVVSTVKSFVATVAGSVVASMSSSVEVATVKSVFHSMSSAYRAVVERASSVPAVTAISVPAVTSAISNVNVRASEVEVVASRITAVNCEVPYSRRPV